MRDRDIAGQDHSALGSDRCYVVKEIRPSGRDCDMGAASYRLDSDRSTYPRGGPDDEKTGAGYVHWSNLAGCPMSAGRTTLIEAWSRLIGTSGLARCGPKVKHTTI